MIFTVMDYPSQHGFMSLQGELYVVVKYMETDGCLV